jgi:hypothetical protein
MIPGRDAPAGTRVVEKGSLCTVRVPWENGSTAPQEIPLPTFNTLYVLLQGFFR